MAKLPAYRGIQGDEISGPDGLGRMSRVINAFMQSVHSALGKRLTFTDNMEATWKTFSLTAGSDFPYTFRHGLTTVKAVLLASVHESNKTSAPVAAYGLDWELNGESVRLKSIQGLTSGTKYSITLLVLAG